MQPSRKAFAVSTENQKPKTSSPVCPATVLVLLALFALPAAAAEVRAWEDRLVLPTYVWEEDINPKFWAMEGGAKLSTTVQGAITYPYVMQDHLSRTKVDRAYRALYLENEYLRVTCLPELGGRLHSVFDKTQGREMFHLNPVIKPGMIAMRGAWISGGVEWNSGPHGHTVTIVSPVDAAIGKNADGSAYLAISNQEQIFRTRWTAKVTLRPGRKYLDEEIRLDNPTDGMHPYYFWNCTAFPNRPGTRFIYPMTLGTDHGTREFFRWPMHEGRDLSWLKNYEIYSSIFAVECSYDFFGAYDVDADRGIVQVADHNVLGGKKAWTWGEWQFGKVAQRNLADEDAPYIEVQSGPLPTQSDYGMLPPHGHVAWREWWYPVHGLGDGFEYATRDVAIQTRRSDKELELRILATGRFPGAACELRRAGKALKRETLDLGPEKPAVVRLDDQPRQPVEVSIVDSQGRVLAQFTTPLPIPKVDPPDPATFAEKPAEQQTAEELYYQGRKHDRATDRLRAREFYEKALGRDPGHVASLRGLAVLDFEAGLYSQAIPRLEKALRRDGDDGLCWFYLGASHLRRGNFVEAQRCGYRAVRCPGTASIGYDLAGRAEMRRNGAAAAVVTFQDAVRTDPDNRLAADHLLLALWKADRLTAEKLLAERLVDPIALVPRCVLLLEKRQSAEAIRGFLGERDFELLEASLVFADLGLYEEAAAVVQAACVDAVSEAERSFLPMYYLAWFAGQRGDKTAAQRWLARAAATQKPKVFASRPEEAPILQFATMNSPRDWQAHLQLGCLLANLGRVDEAVVCWTEAAELNPKSSIAWRNLGLEAASRNNLVKAAEFYRKAIDALPSDQTLYRDLAELLIADNRRPDAVRLLETMPLKTTRRAEITVMLAQAYVDLKRWDECIALLEATPYFVNWEGQDITWRLFNRAHIERGRQRLEKGDAAAALADFEAALTYPANLNVGRSNKPEEAPAQYWRGKALAALGRQPEARAAWQSGAAGADVKGDQNEHRQKCREALEP